jgi:hypothetical protein
VAPGTSKEIAMPFGMEPKHGQDLAKYAKGWTIDNVENSDLSECYWKLTLSKGSRIRTLHLGATELGAWVEQVIDQNQGPRERNGIHIHFDRMVESMTNHMMKAEEGLPVKESIALAYEYLEDRDDPLKPLVGFRCPLTNKEFWTTVGAVVDSGLKRYYPDRMAELGERVWRMQGIW